MHRQNEAWTRPGEAQGAVHVAGAVDLDDAEAGMLLMIRHNPQSCGAAVLDLRAECERIVPGLLNLAKLAYISASPYTSASKGAALRASLGHVDLVITDKDLRIDHVAALGTDAARMSS